MNIFGPAACSTSARSSFRHPAKYITDTDFADDILIITSSLQNAKDLLLCVETAANCLGMYLNFFSFLNHIFAKFGQTSPLP